MARSRAAAARFDPGAAAGRRACRRRDRALRGRSALRAGAAVGDGRPAARPSQFLADLSRRGKTRPAHRHSRRFDLPPRADRFRLAVLSPRGQRAPGIRLRGHAGELFGRRRVPEIPRHQIGADGIRLRLAADAVVAHQPQLARRAHRGAVDRPGAGRDRARSRAFYPAAARRAERRRAQPHYRSRALRRIDPVLDRLPALAIRRRRRVAGGSFRRDAAQDSDRQSAGDLSAFTGGGRRGRAKNSDARGDGAMNKPVPESETKAAQRLGFVDCDIHPVQRSPKDLYPYLEERWREHSETFGGHLCQGLSGQLSFPRMMASGMRADAYPSNGGPPGCDLELMQRQHLDLNGCDTGMMVCLSRGGMEERNLEFGSALAHAVNDWQIHDWVEKDRRLKAGIVVPQDYPEFAVREIDARAENEAFRQVIISPRSSEPLGRRKYW